MPSSAARSTSGRRASATLNRHLPHRDAEAAEREQGHRRRPEELEAEREGRGLVIEQEVDRGHHDRAEREQVGDGAQRRREKGQRQEEAGEEVEQAELEAADAEDVGEPEGGEVEEE